MMGGRVAERSVSPSPSLVGLMVASETRSGGLESSELKVTNDFFLVCLNFGGKLMGVSVSIETSPEQVERPDDVDFLSQLSKRRMSSVLATVTKYVESCVVVVVVVDGGGGSGVEDVFGIVVVVGVKEEVVVVVVVDDSVPISMMGMACKVGSCLSVGAVSSGVVVSLFSSTSFLPSSTTVVTSSVVASLD